MGSWKLLRTTRARICLLPFDWVYVVALALAPLLLHRSVAWLQLDFPNVGGVFPTYEIQVIKLINYVTARDLVRLGVEVRMDCSCCKCH